MAELDTASPLFQAMTGTGKRRGAGGVGTWKLLPGEEQEGPTPPAPWAAGRFAGFPEDSWDSGARFGLNLLHAWELSPALRDAIISSITNSWPSNAQVEDFPITVFENGWTLDGDYPAALALSMAAEFQAWEVWRRLAGALAGGAVIAGWHPWMAADSTNYTNMGLRFDDNLGDEPARSAVQRPAWFAYAVLAEVLGDRIREGRMALPRVSSHYELVSLITREPEEAGIVVLEFRLTSPFGFGGRGAWAYLVLWDPSVPRPGVLGARSLLATPAGGGPSYHGIQVFGFTNSVSTGTTGTDTELPVDSVTPVATRLPVDVFTVEPRMEPKLYLSPCRIDWQIVNKGASTGGGGPFSRPGWMDDPGAPLPVRACTGALKTSG